MAGGIEGMLRALDKVAPLPANPSSAIRNRPGGLVPVYSRRDVLRLSASILGASGLARALPSVVSTQTPATPTIRTRMFWTWDHSTEWVLNRPGAQTLGASNAYGRSTDDFISDYTRLLE